MLSCVKRGRLGQIYNIEMEVGRALRVWIRR